MSAIALLLVTVLLVLVAVVLALIWAAPAGREDRAGFHLDSPEQPMTAAKAESEVAKECVVQAAAKV